MRSSSQRMTISRTIAGRARDCAGQGPATGHSHRRRRGLCLRTIQELESGRRITGPGARARSGRSELGGRKGHAWATWNGCRSLRRPSAEELMAALVRNLKAGSIEGAEPGGEDRYRKSQRHAGLAGKAGDRGSRKRFRRLESRILAIRTTLMENPMTTLETLGPYAATTHVRDTAVYEHPRGASVQWTALGDGSINLKEIMARYKEICPNSSFHLEIITGRPPVVLPYLEPDFWKPIRACPLPLLRVRGAGKISPRLRDAW